MVYLNTQHIDAALNHLKNSITTLLLCESNPSDVGSAQTNAIASISISPSLLVINTESNGKKLTFNGSSSTASKKGIAKYAIFCGSDIEYKCFIGPVALESGEAITIIPIDIWYIENPTLF